MAPVLYQRRSLSSRFRRIRLLFVTTQSVEIAFWAVCIFLLTSPFTFFLVGEDPTAPLARDAATMRRPDNSQALIYSLRVLVFLFALFASLQRWRQTRRDLHRVLPIIWFPAWCLLSALWSDSFATTLNAALALTLLVFTGFLIGVRLPLHLASRALLHSGAIMAVASVLMWWLYPAYGAHQAGDASQAVHAGAWRGVYLHKNHFGPLCAIYLSAVLLASRRVLPSQAYRWGLAALLSFLIIRSWSASAIALVPLALFLTWLAVVLNLAEKLLAGTAAALGGMAAVLSAGVLLAWLGRDATLTGRTGIWQTALEYIAKEPLTGYGYGSGVYAGFVVEVGRLHGVHDAHNGYLDLLLGAGAIGLALFMAVVVVAWIIARGVYSFGGSYGAGALVLAAVLNGFLIAGLTEANVRPLSAGAGLAFCALGILLSAPRPTKISQAGSHAIRQERVAPLQPADDDAGTQCVGA